MIGTIDVKDFENDNAEERRSDDARALLLLFKRCGFAPDLAVIEEIFFTFSIRQRKIRFRCNPRLRRRLPRPRRVCYCAFLHYRFVTQSSRMEASSRHRPRSFDELLERAHGGCAESIGELFQRCRGYLLLIANRQLDPALKAKLGGSDLVQQTLMLAHRDFGQFRGQSERELLGWLQRILLNEAAGARRNYRFTSKRDLSREVPLDPSELAQHGLGSALVSSVKSPSHLARAREDQDRLRQALARLSERDRRIVELRNRDRLTFSEIGLRMGTPPDAARRAWVAAIERLRRELTAADAR